MSPVHKIAAEVIKVCGRLYHKGYVAATDGNMSARLEGNRILSTPTGRNKGDLTIDDLVVLDMEGTPLRGKVRPSTEIQMHLMYYRARPDVQAVVHAHPPYCTGFAAAGQGLAGCVLPEIVVSLGSVPLAPYATPSTGEVPDSIAPFVERHNVILLQNHGVVAAASSPLDAYYALEKTEHAAHILFIARMLGGESRLTQEQVEKLRSISGSSYGLDAGKTPACEPASGSSGLISEGLPQNNLEVSDSILRAIKELGL